MESDSNMHWKNDPFINLRAIGCLVNLIIKCMLCCKTCARLLVLDNKPTNQLHTAAAYSGGPRTNSYSIALKHNYSWIQVKNVVFFALYLIFAWKAKRGSRLFDQMYCICSPNWIYPLLFLDRDPHALENETST
jgi:hypothetical protein